MSMRPEVVEGSLDHPIHLLFARHIGQEGQGLTAQGAHLGGDGFGLLLVAAGVDDNIRALRGELEGGGPGRYCGRNR